MIKTILYTSFLFALLIACGSPTEKIAEQDRIAAKYADSLLKQQFIADSLAKAEFCAPCLYNDSLSKDFSFEKEIQTIEVVTYKGLPNLFGKGKQNRKDSEVLKNGVPAYSDFKETITLKPKQIDSLKKILFNYGHQGSVRQADCYFPRHCVFFKNKEKKVIAYLEICFECNRYETAHDELRLHCDEQFNDLTLLFQSCGLKQDFNNGVANTK